jgi:hypothetical protein
LSYTLQITCCALTFALNLTCSSHDTQMALLPGSIVRNAARLVFTLVMVVAMTSPSAREPRN